jgi:hypothetical protein
MVFFQKSLGGFKFHTVFIISLGERLLMPSSQDSTGRVRKCQSSLFLPCHIFSMQTGS